MQISVITKKILASALVMAFVMPVMAMADLNKVDNRIGLELPTNFVDFDVEGADREQIEAFLCRLYETVHNRAADQAGLEYWANALASGRFSGAYVIHQFIECEEFWARNVNNSDYINMLYRAVLNREPDEAGRAYWLSKLDGGMNREKLTNYFIDSNEWRNLCAQYGITPGQYIVPTPTPRPTSTPTPTPDPHEMGIEGFVRRLYTTVHERTADEAGLQFWIRALQSGRYSGAFIIREFIESEEFRNRNVSNEEYIDILYRAVLGRNPDTTGRNYWLGKLNGGMSRERLTNYFIDSNEWRRICDGYGIVPGVYITPTPSPTATSTPTATPTRAATNDANYERWVASEQRGIQRLNAATNLTPRRSFIEVNVQGSTTTYREIQITDREWQVCEEFARNHFDPSWSNGEKIAYTMYWIHYNVTYATGSGWNAISGMGYAEAVFTRRLGQCAQYNGALTVMMCYLGYDCALVKGYRGTSTTNKWQHYWNEVYINDETYMCEAGNQGNDGSWWYFVCRYSETRKFIKNGVVLG